MIATERMDYILQKLVAETTVTIKEIAASLNVSEATIRRDFERLEQKGLALRVRAGATKTSGSPLGNVAPLITSEKLTEHMEEKNVIAKAAASLIQDGQCIFLDGGTSVAQLIDFIQDKRIKIVTPNLLIPRKLYNMDMDIFLIGGRYMHFHESTVGTYAEKMISQFHFDYAFFGCSGIELNNQLAYNDDIETVPVKEVAMRCADKSVLLADSSKIGKTSVCRFASLSSFDNIIIYEPENLSIGFPSNFTIVKE